MQVNINNNSAKIRHTILYQDKGGQRPSVMSYLCIVFQRGASENTMAQRTRVKVSIPAEVQGSRPSAHRLADFLSYTCVKTLIYFRENASILPQNTPIFPLYSH